MISAIEKNKLGGRIGNVDVEAGKGVTILNRTVRKGLTEKMI